MYPHLPNSCSKKAAGLLADAGYKVVELSSGFLGWQSSGMPVE